jgi:hypothetical protein
MNTTMNRIRAWWGFVLYPIRRHSHCLIRDRFPAFHRRWMAAYIARLLPSAPPVIWEGE